MRQDCLHFGAKCSSDRDVLAICTQVLGAPLYGFKSKFCKLNLFLAFPLFLKASLIYNPPQSSSLLGMRQVDSGQRTDGWQRVSRRTLIHPFSSTSLHFLEVVHCSSLDRWRAAPPPCNHPQPPACAKYDKKSFRKNGNPQFGRHNPHNAARITRLGQTVFCLRKGSHLMRMIDTVTPQQNLSSYDHPKCHRLPKHLDIPENEQGAEIRTEKHERTVFRRLTTTWTF